MARQSDGIFKNRAKKRNGSNASKTQTESTAEDDGVSVSSNKSGKSARLSGGLFKNRVRRKRRNKGDSADNNGSGFFHDDENMQKSQVSADDIPSVSKTKNEIELDGLSCDSFHEANTRWSVAPDTRISGHKANTKKTAAVTYYHNTPSSDDEDGDLYKSEDEDIYNKDESEIPATARKKKVTKKAKKKKKKVEDEDDGSAIFSADGKSKKKKKKSGLTDSSRSAASTGTKKKKKKKSAVAEVNEKVREAADKHTSLKDRIRASLALIGDKGGLLSTAELSKLNLDSPVCGNKGSIEMGAITEDDEDEDEQLEENDDEDETGEDVHNTPVQTSKSPMRASAALEHLAGLPAMQNPTMSPLQKFKLASKRMQDIQHMRACAVDGNFASIFESATRESIDKGLMSESDKETVDKLLKDLQDYEEQLEEERNQISEERDMMQLQQEAVEHLLETETMKTQELETRILELEEILENQVHQQETDEYLMKIEMLESEIERQQDTINTMATARQTKLKRKGAKGPMSKAWTSDRESSTREWSDGEESLGGEGDSEQGGVDRSSFVSVSTIGSAKLQGELLQLRSSLKEKNQAVEDQAKELAKLRQQLRNSEEVQKMHHLEATCADFRNESKQFRSEVDELKKQLAEMEASKLADAEKIEATKQAEFENKKAWQRAEEEKNEALRKLEVKDLLNIDKNATNQSQLRDVLSIDGNNSKSPQPLGGKEDVAEEQKEVQVKGVQPTATEKSTDEEEKSGWFGFGGGDKHYKKQKSDINASEQESKAEKKEKGGFDWFGLGGKDNKEDSNTDGEEEGETVAEQPSMQDPPSSGKTAKQMRLSNVLDF
ncbi:MAG: hypothetical protein SGBAC_005101 [Bacillariaceae sp.]